MATAKEKARGQREIQLSRRKLLLLAGSAATLTLVNACQVVSPGAPSPSAVAQPKPGGILRIGQPFDIVITKPHTTRPEHYSVVYAVFDSIVRLDANYKPQPELAESWDFSGDFKTLTLHFRKGVKFHTGREFTAADVVWNIQRLQDPNNGAQFLALAQSITKMDTPDPYTVTLNFAAPRPAVFDMLDVLFILDPQSAADADTGKRWVGTGPFSWVSWTPGVNLQLKRFDGYWKTGLPYLDGITLNVVSDPQGSIAQLQGSTLDLIVNPALEQVPTLSRQTDLVVLQSVTGGQTYYMGINVATAPLDKKEVRQAINWAIDRKRIVQTALNGVGEPTSAPWPKSSLAYDAAKQNAYTFDLDKSKALLQKVGLASGFDMPFVTTKALPGLSAMTEIIQSDLAKVGIRAKIEEVELAESVARLVGRKYTHAWMQTFGFSQLHPSTVFAVAFPFRPGLNSSFYDSPQYRDLIAKMSAEPDPVAENKLASQMTDLMLDESFVIPISPQRRMWATRANVRDVSWSQYDALLLEKTYLNR